MKKILAIDDQPDNLITIEAVIKTNLHNCQVITALSGKKGITLAETEQPDTILLDIIMPGMDGYEVCKKLKTNKKTKHIPVIMITAIRTDSNSRIKGLNLGADAFLSKPIDPTELSAQVNVMLRIKEAEDKLREEKENLEQLVSARTKQLKESEKLYKSLYDFAPIPYHSLSEEGFFIDINRAWLNLLGYKREEVIGKWYGDFLHPDSVQLFNQRFPKFKNDGAVQNANFKIRQKNGNHIDIILNGRIGFHPNGKFKQTYCVFQDITEKNKIENALRTSEERFRKAFETSPDSININRINDGVYISANNGFTQIMGYSEEEVIGKSSVELDIWVNNDDRQKLVDGLNDKGSVENLDAKFKTKSGKIIDGLMSAAVIDLDGVPHNINITRDVTKRKKAEEAHRESERKLNTLIDNLQGIAYKCKLDQNWTMEYLSAGFESMTGYKNENVINNKKFSFNDLIIPADRERVFREAAEALETKKSFEIKYRIKTANGKIKHVIDRSTAMYSPEKNKPIALEGFIADFSSQVLADEALKKSEEKFRFLAKNSIDCIWTMNKSLEFTYLSPALKRITGYEQEEWIGTKLKSHFTKSEYYKASTFVINAIRENKKQTSVLFETKILDRNNIEVDVEFSGNLMIDHTGKLLGLQGTIRDISNRIVSREALVESEKKFKDLSNLLPQIVYETDLQGNLTFINKIGLETFKYSESDFKRGLNILQGIAPEDKERARNILENIQHNKTKGDPEYKAVRKDGSTFPILIYSSIIYKKEEPVGMRGVIINITQQKEAERSLRENEQKLRLIITNSPVGVSTTDLNGHFVDVNPALCKITGYSKEEMIYKHFNEFSHPDDKIINIKKFTDLVKGEIPYFTLEKRYIHKNGNTIYVLIRSQLITDHKGNPMFQTAVVEDITEQKRAEQIQKVLFNISNAVVTSIDLEKLISLIRIELGTIIDTTNFFVALYDEINDIISLPFFADEKDNHSFIPKGKTLTKYVIETEKSLLANIELKKELHKKGQLDYIGSLSKIWLGVPLKTEGKVTGVLALQSYKDENAFTESDMKMLEFVSEQISISIQRKKAETDLKSALDKANESDRLKSSFLATISHELRTPLNAIIGFSEFLDKNLPLTDVEKFGQIINTSGNHLLSIVNDLFDITLIESGETKIKKENVRIKMVLQDVYSVIENYNARKDISGVEFKLESPLEYDNLIIKTDSNKLKQILINLLKNAFKFTEKGCINYGYEIVKENKNRFLRFYVQDTGIGISQDKQELIFDIFRQAEDSNKRRFGGTGIGLSVAKRLAELLGGKIWLKSEIKKGSIFYFTIPAEKSELETIKAETQNKIKSADRNNLVLVAEDDDSSYVYLKTVLNKFGFKSIRAINGKAAIDICYKNPEINLILMDINMPIMNGYEATKIIKAKFPHISIIAQTAYAVAGDREKVFEAGCDEYISKPIQQEVLMDKIEKIYALKNSGNFA